jgi:hypothetical protein
MLFKNTQLMGVGLSFLWFSFISFSTTEFVSAATPGFVPSLPIFSSKSLLNTPPFFLHLLLRPSCRLSPVLYEQSFLCFSSLLQCDITLCWCTFFQCIVNFFCYYFHKFFVFFEMFNQL